MLLLIKIPERKNGAQQLLPFISIMFILLFIWGCARTGHLGDFRLKESEEKLIQLDGGILIVMEHIPSGTFRMGGSEKVRDSLMQEGRRSEAILSGYSDSFPVHEVVISRGFWIGKTEVSQAQYESVMKINPSYFQGSNLPVEQGHLE